MFGNMLGPRAHKAVGLGDITPSDAFVASVDIMLVWGTPRPPDAFVTSSQPELDVLMLPARRPNNRMCGVGSR